MNQVKHRNCPRRKYTEEHIEFIKLNYYKYSSKELAELFNKKFNSNTKDRTLATFATKVLGLNKNKDLFKFTPIHDDWLRLNYGNYNITNVTSMFNSTFHASVSELAIRYRARDVLKVSRRFVPDKYTAEEIAFIKANHSKYIYRELTDLLNKTFGTNRKYLNVLTFCNSLGLYKDINVGCYGLKKRKEYYKEGDLLAIKHRNYIKINNKTRMVAGKYYYEKYYGIKVPKESIILFLDGNKLNFSKDNLYCINRKILGKLIANGLYHLDDCVSKESLEIAIKICELFYLNKRIYEED